MRLAIKGSTKTARLLYFLLVNSGLFKIVFINAMDDVFNLLHLLNNEYKVFFNNMLTFNTKKNGFMVTYGNLNMSGETHVFNDPELTQSEHEVDYLLDFTNQVSSRELIFKGFSKIIRVFNFLDEDILTYGKVDCKELEQEKSQFSQNHKLLSYGLSNLNNMDYEENNLWYMPDAHAYGLAPVIRVVNGLVKVNKITIQYPQNYCLNTTNYIHNQLLDLMPDLWGVLLNNFATKELDNTPSEKEYVLQNQDFDYVTINFNMQDAPLNLNNLHLKDEEVDQIKSNIITSFLDNNFVEAVKQAFVLANQKYPLKNMFDLNWLNKFKDKLHSDVVFLYNMRQIGLIALKDIVLNEQVLSVHMAFNPEGFLAHRLLDNLKYLHTLKGY